MTANCLHAGAAIGIIAGNAAHHTESRGRHRCQALECGDDCHAACRAVLHHEHRSALSELEVSTTGLKAAHDMMLLPMVSPR